MFCALIYLCSTMNGYDGSLMGSINSLKIYQAYYNVPENDLAGTGIVFSIFQIGQMAGALFIWVADWRGRRLPIFVGCLGVCVGTIVTSTAKTIPIFTGGRFLLSFFSTIASTAAPLFLIEIAPPLTRGTVAGMYNTLYYMGSIIATFTIYGTFLHMEGNLQWRLPLWLQMTCPGLVCLGIWFAPESPRWLVGMERYEEARAFVVEYHANGDPNHPIVELEMNEMTESMREQGILSWRNFFDIRMLFKSRSRRYRMMLNIAMSWFGQFSGNNIASYYLPLLVANVGITDQATVLLLNGIYALTGWIAAGFGARLHDIVGRRKMLFGSALGMAFCLAIVAGTAAGFVQNPDNKACSSASIAFIYIFGCVFAISFTSMQPIYPGEVLSNDMRAKGMGVFQLTSGTAGFVNTFAAPIALKNIGYWFYVFFVFWDLFEAAFIYFFFVETKGRTLEELDEVFEAPNPRKASTKKMLVQRVHVKDDEGPQKSILVV
ncbi:general substrate transporter [Hyaloscypha variabilis F]|uniref:General substrate transporter n=1 Tax=Hyaloscypha variabilis (strain UAMH 11265 / GT02V1 / F) TaxID=1149755 RepID=A0A2J6S447_HYAVF|nr:general substrate transporter [Hyaloscypha variabilis F]